MVTSRVACILFALLLVLPCSLATAEAGFDDLLQPIKYQQVRVSPDGDKLAVVSMEEGKRVLALMTLDPLEITYVLRFDGRQEVGDFHWANDDRLVTSVWERWGWMDHPTVANYLYALDYDGGARRTVFGYNVGYNQGATASRIRKQQMHTAHADIISTLPDDPKHILISTYPWDKITYRYGYTGESYGEVLRLNIYNGRTRKLAQLPGRGGRGFADFDGTLRFANGVRPDGTLDFYQFVDGEWQRSEKTSVTRQTWPVGYSEDGRHAYLLSGDEQGRDVLQRMSLESGELSTLYAHPRVDVSGVARYPGTGEPMAVHTDDGLPAMHFFDPAHPVSRYIRGIGEAFPGYRVTIESETPDGRVIVVSVSGDNRPGDLFLIDLETRRAEQLLSAAGWLEPDALARTESFDFKNRDGIELQGYLTFPLAGERRALPMIVVPHGGPAARDYWQYNRELQVLARAGYLVMQVNFRGSDGYGTGFQTAAYGHWGDLVQDDIADATRWVIEQGFADRERVCIYGGSFGAYSALMNTIREPDLYRCAAGFAGVYDLELMHEVGDIQGRMAGQAYLDRAIGDDAATLARFSPAANAGKVKVPVFLAHGGEDQRAPIDHARALESALREANVDVTVQYYDAGGHGYYSTAANRRLYRGLLDFFAEHIGPG